MKNLYYFLSQPFTSIIGNHPQLLMRAIYFKNFHRKIDLKNPVLFHDKIIWMSLNTDTSRWSVLADKYSVRDYVKKIVGDSVLTKLYGVYDSPDDINFVELPNQFVLKTNNGCTSNIIVKDKTSLDIENAKYKLRYWMKLPYGELSGQPHYSRISPKKIIAEEFLIQPESPENSLIDYKFNCFNGVPVSCAAFSDRKEGTHSVNRMLYDMDWNAHPEWYDESKEFERKELPCPVNFEKMKEIASRLSQGFPYVRVDLYSINERVVFGELTFIPGADAFYSTEYQKVLGDMIKLPERKG